MHSEEHKSNAKPPEIPWHDHIVNDDMPTYPNAPAKRTPIRGLQFFMPSTAWYCKLCAYWIGDLHCASAHLKSVTHSTKYDEYIAKNPDYDTKWLGERTAAFAAKKEKIAPTEREIAPPPPPPVISAPQPQKPPSSAMPFVPTTVFDGIPLKIGHRTKENSISEDSQKKGKKKKKEKKKRKKSKKKHHRHSTSSSSSSSSEEDTSDSAAPTSEQNNSPDKTVPDPSTSIRVAMRNAAAPSKDAADKPENGEQTSGWMLVQEPKVIAPQPPTISANGEAQNRRDEMIISQWSTPIQPVISDQEKQFLSQLKDKLKSREEAKTEKAPPPPPSVPAAVKTVPPIREEKPKEAPKPVAKRDDDDKRRVDKDRDKDRERDRNKDKREINKKKRTRSRSPSPSPARRDRYDI